MVNITLALNDDIHKRMSNHSEIKWSEIVRKAIEKKLLETELEQRILSKSKLTIKDVNELSGKIKKEMFKELNESKNSN